MHLPYTDSKPQGAPDFYFAINATFRFILAKLGPGAWVRYLEELGRDYFEPVNASWRKDGLPAVAGYWRAFFAAEPGGDVRVHESAERVEIDVRVCPAIRHLRAAARPIVPDYCRHCYHLGNARAQAAGMSMRLEGGNGACRHTYHATCDVAAQDFSRIKEAH